MWLFRTVIPEFEKSPLPRGDGLFLMIPPSLLVLLFNGWPGRSSIARLDEALLRARVRRAGR